MKTATKVFTAITAIAGIVVELAPLVQAWLAAHPHMTFGALAAAIMLALGHNPVKGQ